MSFKAELARLIDRHLPERVTILGKVTHAQTWESPEEREELKVKLCPQDAIRFMGEEIDNLVDKLDEFWNNESKFIAELQKEWDNGN